MQRRQYTPTKTSQLLHSTAHTQPQTYAKQQQFQQSTYNKPQQPTYTKPEYQPSYSKLPSSQYTRPLSSTDQSIQRQYQALKMAVKQLQYQNRQLSTQSQKLRYQKNLNDNKYLQKISYQQQTLNQFQKQKNYQLQLVKIKGDQDLNRTRRQFELKLDDYHRQLKTKDYHNRQINQKNSYSELKNNQLKKGIESLQGQLIKFRQNNNNLQDYLTKQQFNKKKLEILTSQLQHQKCQMESEIHILLDIQAQKSRNINSLEVQLRNSQTTQRCLHEKLAILTQNFANLEDHISIMKQRLISADVRNQQIQKQLQASSLNLGDKENMIVQQKELQVRLRNELQRQQGIQLRRQNQLKELLLQNQRLFKELNINRQRLHDMCITQGIDI